MPCRDGREDDDNEDNAHMRRGAELLCTLLREKEARLESVPAEFTVWWEEHKKRDRVRERGW